MMRSSLCGLALVLVLAAPAVRADAPESGAENFEALDRLMPQRERDFLAIIGDARSQLKLAHTAPARADLRLAMQLKILKFVQEAIEAERWVGIVKLNGHTRDGDVWLETEIAPDVTLMTVQNPATDPDKLTLIGPASPLFKDAENLKVGEKITFSGNLIRYVLLEDEAMVQRPQLLVHFTEIRPLIE